MLGDAGLVMCDAVPVLCDAAVVLCDVFPAIFGDAVQLPYVALICRYGAVY
jgi:hypothetical protein